jgi:3-hydroxyisobutyrate dehydrogenase
MTQRRERGSGRPEPSEQAPRSEPKASELDLAPHAPARGMTQRRELGSGRPEPSEQAPRSGARSEPKASEVDKVGWIGSGVMGASMCGHLLAAGHPVTLHSRTRAKADGLLERGAVWADSPAAVAERSDVVFSIVGFPNDVREVVLGPTGALAGARAGTTLVEMTTSEPALAREIAAAARVRDVGALDAPVSGGDVGARAATLSIMVGGDAAHLARVRPLLEKLGRTIVHHGPAGAGQHAKLVNQMLIAGNMIGVCEALLFAQRAGLDPARVIESVSSGAAASWGVQNLGPKIASRDLAPGFYVEHFVKDMEIALREGERMGLALPGLDLAARLYREVVALGHGRSGTQALVLALERLAKAPA